ncbi:LysR family substrate-binding domain-containing protein [Enterobacter kobei]|uniref:LysR family substrate-binding domain-containing protein n=1 Tax=Enterobacter kobei TaxID=208224 RepID=UPI001C70193C|nr:LysR family substrate-binding domain-containing protein [Enterobacter kobei]MBW9427431.1 LysR family substrate-binding domain-containing protein [Enterobacter kobei]
MKFNHLHRRFFAFGDLFAPSLSQCQKAGFSPHIGLEVSSQQTIVNFVANGFGVALIPASMQHAQIRGVVYKELAGANTVQNVLMWNARNKNPSLKRFLSLCREIRDELNTAQAGE